jgi:hypothetical protein
MRLSSVWKITADGMYSLLSIAERYIGDSLEIKAATVNRMHGEKKTGRDIESQL